MDEQFVSGHPELHHYTSFDGLRGIVQSNTLWATHFSYLNDTTEITHLKEPLSDVLAQRFFKILKARQRESLRIRRAIQKIGGLKKHSMDAANGIVRILYDITFSPDDGFGEPFITSFCSHAADHEYERAHGLLSQWRGYGGQGGYCVVFDTAGVVELVRREYETQFYVHLNVYPTQYGLDNLSLEQAFPTLLEECDKIMLKGTSKAGLTSATEAFAPFVAGATLFKHQGFREEREVRIVALPGHQRLINTVLAKQGVLIKKPIKQIHLNPKKNKRHIHLFDSLGAMLPIKRIIVGPSQTQMDNCERTKQLVGTNIPVSLSATPFIH